MIVGKFLSKSIEDRARFSLYDVEPSKFVPDLLVPTYFLLGQTDEFIDVEEFNKMFISHPMVKVLKAVPGGHAEERDDRTLEDALKFVQSNFDNIEMIEGVELMREHLVSQRRKRLPRKLEQDLDGIKERPS